MKKYVIKSFIFLMMIFMMVSCRESVNNIKESVAETVTETPIFTVGEQEMFYDFYDYTISNEFNVGDISYEIISNDTTLKVNVTYQVVLGSYAIGDITQIEITKVNGKYTQTITENGITEMETVGGTIMETIISVLVNK